MYTDLQIRFDKLSITLFNDAASAAGFNRQSDDVEKIDDTWAITYGKKESSLWFNMNHNDNVLAVNKTDDRMVIIINYLAQNGVNIRSINLKS